MSFGDRAAEGRAAWGLALHLRVLGRLASCHGRGLRRLRAPDASADRPSIALALADSGRCSAAPSNTTHLVVSGHALAFSRVSALYGRHRLCIQRVRLGGVIVLAWPDLTWLKQT